MLLIDASFHTNLGKMEISYQLEVDLVEISQDNDMLTTPHLFSTAIATTVDTAVTVIIVCYIRSTTSG